jgi:hypothetical protein
MENEIKNRIKVKIIVDVLTAANIKINVFSAVTPCSLIGTNVSEEPAASIFRVYSKRT